MKLEGSVAIVTGGSSGLGLGACIQLQKEGCIVIMVDINEEGEKIGKENKCEFMKCDVTKEEQIKEIVKKVVEKHKKINILVNCAGIIVAQPIVTSKETADSERLRKVIEVNVVGTFNMCKHVAMQMSKQGKVEQYENVSENGVIMNVASVAGIEGQRGQVMYSATKGAIIGMTLPMARDLGRFNIRVVTIAPGIFDTPMGKQIPQKVKDTMNAMTPLGRAGHIKEFSQMVVSVAHNSYLNGAVLRLDGAIRLAHL